MKTSFVLPLLLLGIAGDGQIALAQSPGTFTATGPMTTARRGNTATLLTDGRVLIAGGWAVPESDASVATAELYDPATGTFSATGRMTTKRRYHSATLLPDGRVLIAGGTDSGSRALATAELYDPSTGTFSATGSMAQARTFSHVATLLPNGKVLIAGGYGSSTITVLISAEVYDPIAGRFSFTVDLVDPIPEVNTAILLPGGKVFIGGPGISQLYDYQRESFGITDGWGSIGLSWPDTQTLLANGNILVAGGDPDYFGSSSLAGVYNLGTGKFSPTGSMRDVRDFHTSTLLPDGTVLIAGGQVDGGGTLASAEVYDPSIGMFGISGNMITNRCCHTATLLNSGQVLITGGGSPDLATAELYNPPQMKPAPVLFALSGDSKGQGAIWNAITGQVASSGAPAKEGEALSMYTTGLISGGAIPPQIFIGDRLAEVLFFGDAPGYPGYNQVNFRVPAGVAPAAVVPVRVSYLGRSSNQVTIAVQ
jgi:hypothetical protein